MIKILVLNIWIVILLLSTYLYITGCSEISSSPNAEKIKADLVGKVMMLGVDRYEKFESYSNIKMLEIQDENNQGSIIEYKVKIDYFDAPHDILDNIDGVIVYRKDEGKWAMISMSGRLNSQLPSN